MPRHRLSKRLRRARSRVLAGVAVVVAAAVAETERGEGGALWPRGRGEKRGIGELVWVLAWARLEGLGLGLRRVSSR